MVSLEENEDTLLHFEIFSHLFLLACAITAALPCI